MGWCTAEVSRRALDREEGARELMESYRIPLRSLLTLDEVRGYRS